MLKAPGTPDEAVFQTISLAANPEESRDETEQLILEYLSSKGKTDEEVYFEEFQIGKFPGTPGYMALTGWFIPNEV